MRKRTPIINYCLLIIITVSVASSLAASDWQKSPAGDPWAPGVEIPAGGRPNPYLLDDPSFRRAVDAGRRHALHYPVTVTGVQLPYQPVQNIFQSTAQDPLRLLIAAVFRSISNFHSFEEMEAWLGLVPYPKKPTPEIPDLRNGHRMGFTLLETPRGKAFTMSCAQCHTGQLFGRPVLGMSNRFPRANAYFERGLQASPHLTPGLFQWATMATEGETDLYRSSRRSLRFVRAKRPVQLGLDTSLAQVSLSLSSRSQDPWAERDPKTPSREHQNPLQTLVADSKPAVWWTTKYKNRWLSDGSVVSGNPIFTNFLWNEIGRGSDLHDLSDWLRSSESVVKALTTAVFASEPPKITEFFDPTKIDEAKARRGETLFNQACARCHGTYVKNWSLPGAEAWPWIRRLQTAQVIYRKTTPVVNVGTDPGRYRGMKALTPLNDLQISRIHGIWIEPQQGYVPPPLVGIWARWPYFHNNSAPSLCDVLLPIRLRARAYWAREALDSQRDFNFACNGYPRGDQPSPGLRKSAEYYYDTRREGLSNAGHDEGILSKNGEPLFSASQREDLIRFLQTL